MHKYQPCPLQSGCHARSAALRPRPPCLRSCLEARDRPASAAPFLTPSEDVFSFCFRIRVWFKSTGQGTGAQGTPERRTSSYGRGRKTCSKKQGGHYWLLLRTRRPGAKPTLSRPHTCPRANESTRDPGSLGCPARATCAPRAATQAPPRTYVPLTSPRRLPLPRLPAPTGGRSCPPPAPTRRLLAGAILHSRPAAARRLLPESPRTGRARRSRRLRATRPGRRLGASGGGGRPGSARALPPSFPPPTPGRSPAPLPRAARLAAPNNNGALGQVAARGQGSHWLGGERGASRLAGGRGPDGGGAGPLREAGWEGRGRGQAWSAPLCPARALCPLRLQRPLHQ